jgi:Zn-dependent peptidase ImmA (M78 family)
VTSTRSVNKAACKRLAAELRAEIGLHPMDALDPWKLAELYGITVIAISALPLTSEIREHFTNARPEVFSGALLPIGTGAAIIENDAHTDARRRSTMGHELAHVAGEHQFGTSLVNERGCRLADQVQEEEAAEIGGELLIPFEAAKKLARRKATNEEVALQFGVSVEMARWRMDATGARLIAARQAVAYKRARGA